MRIAPADATAPRPSAETTTTTTQVATYTLRILVTTRNHQDGRDTSGMPAPVSPPQVSPPTRRAAGHFPMLDDHG